MNRGDPSFTNIDVDVKLPDVEIRIAEDDACGCDIRGKRYSKISSEIRDSTLFITETVHYFLMPFYFWDILRGAGRAGVTVYVPKDAPLDAVKLRNTSGNLGVHGKQCKTLEVSATSGNILAVACSAEIFRARQTSGGLDLDGCRMGNGEISKSSGKLDIQNSNLRELGISATSGSLEIQNTNLERLTISASSGNTVFTGGIIGRADIRSTSGGITLDITAKKKDYGVTIDTGSGNVCIDGRKQKRLKDKPYNTGGNGRNELRLKSTSGDVRINFN